MPPVPYKRLQLSQTTSVKIISQIPKIKNVVKETDYPKITSKKKIEKIMNKEANPSKKHLFNFQTDPNGHTFSSLAALHNKEKSSFLEINRDRIKEDPPLSNIDFDINLLKSINLPDPKADLKIVLKNDEENEEIEIVDNYNKKIKVKVTNLAGKTTLRSFESIPNQINFPLREENFKSLSFTNDFRSGYAPIEIQKTQEKDFSQAALNKEKSHFIKKKQSCAQINLKRTCGVSYVKKTESQQLNVSHIFEPLPPLVYQCSSECEEINDITEFEAIFLRIFGIGKLLLCSVLEAEEEEVREYLLHSEKRAQINKNKVFLVKDYKEIWPLFLDKIFILVHLFYDVNETIVNFDAKDVDIKNIAVLQELIKKSQLQLVIQMKKNLSGKKTYVKTLGPDFNSFLEDTSLEKDNKTEETEDNKSKTKKEKPKFLSSLMNKLQEFFFKGSNKNQEESESNTTMMIRSNENTNFDSICTTAMASPNKLPTQNFHGVHPSILTYLQKDPKMKNINTCSVRMELYLEESLWKSLSENQKNQLNGLILCTDETFQKESVQMSNKRMTVFESNNPRVIMEAFQKIQICDEKGLRVLNIEDIFPNANENKKFKEINSFSLPLYYISTRDCFAFDLLEKKTILQLPGRPNVLKTEYFFHPHAKPQNFKSFEKDFPDLRVGVTSYTNFFSHEELLDIENKTFDTEIKCFKSNLKIKVLFKRFF